MGCCNTTLRLKDKARKNIDECYDLLDTGDLVLMQLRLRNGCPIETATCATFSHVGVIIREQTPHYTSIYVSHSLNNRVSRHTLRGVLTKVKGGFRAVCARKLKTPLSPDQKERLIEYCNRYIDACML